MSNIKNANINISLKDLFFKWLDITKSFHKLGKQQQEVLALLLYHHYKLKKEITNNKILWKMVFDYETKLRIKEDSVFKVKNENGLTDSALQNILSTLRKKGIIINNEISPVFIPDLTTDSKNFKVIFNFNIVDND